MPVGQSTFVSQVSAAVASLGEELALASVSLTSRQSADGSKFAAGFEGPDVLALVEAWEQGPFLDISIHRSGEKVGTIVAAGLCEGGGAELSRRIALVREAFLSEGRHGST